MKHTATKVTIDLTKPETHRAQITITRGSHSLPAVLEFPVWTPGSYLVREYARHVTFHTNAQKLTKNQWRPYGNPSEVKYEAYCFERTVRTSFLDENYASLVGATLLPLLGGPFEVELLVPAAWSFVSSALNFKKRGPGRWVASARDDDHWIDSPIIAAAPGFGGKGTFSLRGIPHHIAWVGLRNARSMRDLEKSFKEIAETTIETFGGAPFQEYWFLLHFGQKLYGGLEHRDSQLSQFDGQAIAEDKDYDSFLRLIAHEYLHAWNVKSIRPRALGPFDYTAENYTQDIWFSEGLTDYLDDYLCWKAGIISEDAYWKARVKDASLLPDGNPGHTRRSLAESSFDAWIRYYRNDEDSINTDVSYYSKGALLGWCWDAHLSKSTKNKWTLPKLMKAIYKEFGIDAYVPLSEGKPGFTREELLQFAEKITGVRQAAMVEAWVTNRKPLPWKLAAKFYGLEIDEKISDALLHFTGMQAAFRPGCFVAKVISGSAAERAALAPNDEILAINGMRITDADSLAKALTRARGMGKKANLLIARLDMVMDREITFAPHAQLGVEYVKKA
jgi:predicted metalloprotease with PDZ domain